MLCSVTVTSFVFKTVAMHLLLMHINTGHKNHQEAPSEIQIMYACTVSIKIVQGFRRLYFHDYYILAKRNIIDLNEGYIQVLVSKFPLALIPWHERYLWWSLDGWGSKA